MTARTISASALRSNLADALDGLAEDDVLIVTRRGREKKPQAIISLDRLEDLLAASNPEYLKVIKKARQSDEYFTHEEVFGNL